MDSLAHTTVIDSEIINENCVAANPEIGSNGGVVFGLTLFFLGVYIPHLGFMMNAGGNV